MHLAFFAVSCGPNTPAWAMPSLPNQEAQVSVFTSTSTSQQRSPCDSTKVAVWPWGRWLIITKNSQQKDPPNTFNEVRENSLMQRRCLSQVGIHPRSFFLFAVMQIWNTVVQGILNGLLIHGMNSYMEVRCTRERVEMTKCLTQHGPCCFRKWSHTGASCFS